MNYAADGPLDPPFMDVNEVTTYELSNILGYTVDITEWSDQTYTMYIYRGDEWKSEEIIEDGEITYDSRPDEESITLRIEEVLEERADRSMQ